MLVLLIVGLLAVGTLSWLLSSLLLHSSYGWFKFEWCPSTYNICVMSTISKMCHRCLFHEKKISIVKCAPFRSMQLFKYLIVKYSIIVLLAITCPVATTSSFVCALKMWFYLVVFLMTIQLVSLGILQVSSLTIAWSLIYRRLSFVLWWSWKWSEWWCSC